MSAPGERLTDLASLVDGVVVGDGDVVIRDVTHDSRQVGAGTMFAAIRGMTVDGHDFVPEALAREATAVLCERRLDVDIPQLVVDDSRAVMARIAAAVHGNPSDQLTLVGLTGTNGKTSVSFILESLLRSVGRATGLIGTIVTRVGDDLIPTLRTTPESSDLQRLLRAMVDRGADTVVTEVSSHAMRLGRVEATHFDVVGFTNLSHDHLDFHRDMEDYYQAKRSLFTAHHADRGVVCIDDEWGRRLANDTEIEIRTVSMERDADYTATITSRSLSGTGVTMTFPGDRTIEVTVPLIGDFNATNALLAAACAVELGVDVDRLPAALEAVSSAPGRFELVSGDDPMRVIVDYAHTPDGISSVIRSVRALADGRVIAVVGAGGDRDRDKRPLMGQAGSAADVLVVTSDNPRSEEPESIIDAIVSGVEGGDVVRLVDRREAITAAIRMAEDGDVVLVLGKGHERSQEIGDRVLPFDDRLVARSVLAERRGRDT